MQATTVQVLAVALLTTKIEDMFLLVIVPNGPQEVGGEGPVFTAPKPL